LDSDDDADSVATPTVPQNVDVTAPHSANISLLSLGDDHSVTSTLSTAKPSRPKTLVIHAVMKELIVVLSKSKKVKTMKGWHTM